MKKFKFSFFELLLIFAVTAIFAGVLIPVLQAAQQAQEKASCADQSRKLGAAFAAFAENNDGYLPRTQLGAEEKINGQIVLWTYNMINKGFISNENLICPDGFELLGDSWSKGKIRSLRSAKKNSDVFSYSFYGYNAIGAGGGYFGSKPVKLTNISKIILTADSWDGNNYKIARYIGSSVIADKPTAGRGMVYPLHDGKATVLWSDGSVSDEVGGDFPHEAWEHGVFAVKSNWKSVK